MKASVTTRLGFSLEGNPPSISSKEYSKATLLRKSLYFSSYYCFLLHFLCSIILILLHGQHRTDHHLVILARLGFGVFEVLAF